MPTNTNVTVANIIIGPCTSFKLGSTELGGTSGGVQVELKETMQGLQVDQVPGDVAVAVKDQVLTVKTMLAEATLTNLQAAWSLSAAPVVVTGPPPSQQLNIGVERGIKTPQTLTFVGPCPSGTYTKRTYTLNKVVSMATGAHTLGKDKETLIPVEFQAFPDLTQPAGSEYGSIADS